MTTLFSSQGATGGQTRWLVLTWREDAGPEADPSPPPPRRIAPHRPRAPPAPPPPPRAPPPHPPPQSPILRSCLSPPPTP
jgi:hypothetical protein